VFALVIIAAGTIYSCSGTTDNRWDQTRSQMREIKKGLDLYWLENGTYPSSLDVLHGACFKTMPTDPFSKRGYIYEGNGNLFLLFCLGGDWQLGAEGIPDLDSYGTLGGEVCSH